MCFAELNLSIQPPNEAARQAARARWNRIAKPIGSLGLLEEAVIRMAALTGDADVRLCKRAALVLCADNGVVAEGVTQTGQEVTALVAGNIAKGVASVSRMAAVARCEVFPLDVGMANAAAGVRDLHIARGTQNMATGPAMTRTQAIRAIKTGMDCVGELKARDYSILAAGEMGIGNTTTASAMLCALLALPVSEAVGRGAGLSDAGLARKTAVIARALAVHAPDAAEPLDVLAKLGGLDIAAMAGVFLGGALYRIPVLIDGFISAVAALTAVRLCPACHQAVFATHVSAEPAAERVLAALSLRPLITAGLRLGEGTGALCALPLLDMALSVYHTTATFDEIGLEPYEAPVR